MAASGSEAVHGKVTTILARGERSLHSYLAEVWRYRDLLFFLVLRDIRVRYSQTVLGFGWSVLQPFLQMVVFSIFFGALAGISSGDVPYPAFSLAAVVPWIYFLNAVSASSISLIANAQLVSKVYFPRILIPLAPIGAGLVDLAIALVLLFVVVLAYGIVPPFPELLLLPVLIVLLVLAAVGISIWLAALGAQYRDVRFVTPFFLQTLLFVTPIIYVVSEVPERLRLLYSLNPLVGVVSGFRAAVLGQGSVPWGAMTTSLVVSLILAILGLAYFRRVERAFADVA
jgi:lipopolysaccharide transport system permease protein